MSRWLHAAAMVLAIGCGENAKGTASSVEQHADAPPGTRDDFSEALWSCPDLADRFDCLNQVDALVSNSIGDT